MLVEIVVLPCLLNLDLSFFVSRNQWDVFNWPSWPYFHNFLSRFFVNVHCWECCISLNSFVSVFSIFILFIDCHYLLSSLQKCTVIVIMPRMKHWNLSYLQLFLNRVSTFDVIHEWCWQSIHGDGRTRQFWHHQKPEPYETCTLTLWNPQGGFGHETHGPGWADLIL